MHSPRSRVSLSNRAKVNEKNEGRRRSHDFHCRSVWFPCRSPNPEEYPSRRLRGASVPGVHRRHEHVVAACHVPYWQGQREERGAGAVRRRSLVRARHRRERMRLGSCAELGSPAPPGVLLEILQSWATSSVISNGG